MSVDDRPNRQDETEGLLGGHSDQQVGGSIEYSVWVQYSLYASRAAKAALRTSKIYVLLVFVPLGISARTFGWHSIAISIFNLLAIIPLSALVSYSAEELSIYVGELVGGLINATFGNAVELIVCHP